MNLDDAVYEIVRATAGSAQTLSQLWADAFRQAYADVHSRENIQAYCDVNFSRETARAELNDESVVCKIAQLGGVLAGFYVLKHQSCPVPLGGISTELKQIYILEDQYGKGLGVALYEDALQAARGLGGEHLWLCVSDINERAKSFYRKLDFKAVGTGPIFEVGSDRLMSTVMAKTI